MTYYIVDTNVAVVANSRDDEYPVECQISCIEYIQTICGTTKHRIVLDDIGDILEEYRKHLSASGQPGVGDLFYRHLINFRGNHKRVVEVTLPKCTTTGEYVDFPDHVDLSGFDLADRKFVAAARVSKGKILNAVDSDYSECKAAFNAVSIKIIELCPKCLTSLG